MAKSSVESDSRVFAFLGVFLSIIGFLIVILAKKDDKYAMYYAKQGLVLFIAYIVVWIASVILAFIPVIGWIIALILWILVVVLWLVGWISALTGVEKPIPIIGKFAEKWKL